MLTWGFKKKEQNQLSVVVVASCTLEVKWG